MWESDTITGLWQPREVFNANWLRDYSIQRGAMQSTVCTRAAATPDSHLTQGIAQIWSRQMSLLWLHVNDRDILRWGERFDWTRCHEKQGNEKQRLWTMYSIAFFPLTSFRLIKSNKIPPSAKNQFQQGQNSSNLWHPVTNMFFVMVKVEKYQYH